MSVTGSPDFASLGRARILDRLLELGLKLPDPVSAALSRRRAILDLRLPAASNPGVVVNQALESAAFDLAQAPGDDIVLDVTGVAAARVAEAESRDRVSLLAATRQAADATVGLVVDRNAGAVLQLLQARYSEVAKNFVPAVRRLPQGLTVEQAIRIGGQVQKDWLAIEEGVVEFARLRELIGVVGDARERQVPDAQTQAARWAKSPVVWQSRTPRARLTYEPLGPEGSRQFFEALARQVDAPLWWCPTVAQARAYVATAPWAEKVGAR